MDGFANQRRHLPDEIVADGPPKDFVDIGQSGQSKAWQCPGVVSRETTVLIVSAKYSPFANPVSESWRAGTWA